MPIAAAEAPVSVGPALSESDSRGGGGGVRPLSVQEADDAAHAFVGPASMRYKILRLAYPTLGGAPPSSFPSFVCSGGGRLWW